MTPKLMIRNMTRPEVDELVTWAAREGWNPGRHDAEVFWATDPDAFIAADLDGELIGGGAITAYQGEFGFMGFFIVRPEFRGQGLGNRLWHARRERLIARLRPGATIGMDGVFNMQAYYAKGGFVFSHRDIRFRAEIPDQPPTPPPGRRRASPPGPGAFRSGPRLRPHLLPRPPPDLPGRLDQPTRRPRPRLPPRWPTERLRRDPPVWRRLQDRPPVRRRCLRRQALYAHLAGFAAGGPLFLDTPENNPAALALARQEEMVEVFGCARMYLGPTPDLAHSRIFGVTTFELG
jgi:GNAT superfamily N-acetyltransferase